MAGKSGRRSVLLTVAGAAFLSVPGLTASLQAAHTSRSRD
jgi:hypothetical protein